MMLFNFPKFFALDDDGNPLVGGKLYSYQAGTTTPLDTYTDQAGGTANANPVILDSRGEADVWLDDANYKFSLYDADDNLIWTVDNISSFADDSVTTAKIADDAVTTAKIADSNVTTAKINDLAVTTGKLAAEAVTTAKIADENVTTAKLADNAVTPGKMSAQNIETSTSGSGSFTTTSTSPTAVTNLSKSITTNGRAVLIMLQRDPSTSNAADISVTDSGGVAAGGYIHIYREGAEIAEFYLRAVGGGTTTISLNVPPSIVSYIDEPAAGTYTYDIRAKVDSGDTIGFADCILKLVEL